jgi:hypothetical protein
MSSKAEKRAQQFSSLLTGLVRIPFLFVCLLGSFWLGSLCGVAVNAALERFIGPGDYTRWVSVATVMVAIALSLKFVAPLIWKGLEAVLGRLEERFEVWVGAAGANPTAGWREDPRVPLVLDLDKNSFCGVRLGQPLVGLSHLGPADDSRLARRGLLTYRAQRVYLWAEEERLHSVETSFVDERGRPLPEPPVVVRRAGRPLPLKAGMSRDDIIALLGPPTRVEELDGKVVELLYDFPEATWSVDFTPDDTINGVNLYPPLPPEEREADEEDSAKAAVS